ncbi:MAG: hypothetical protein IJ598_03575 [Ruminococcus sp.]|nr:hypothetical protein [Ruminococcus sp.]
MKKRLLALVSASLISCFCTACFSGSVNTTDSVVKNLPAKVDLRNYDGKNYVTPVKRQSFGDCWSFSLAGSAETAYLYANHMGVDAGELNNNVDFSEKYIAWYMYHGMTDEDVVKGKVKASQVGEGFDPKEAEAFDANAVFDIGGEFVHYGNLFGSGFGPVDENTTVNHQTPYVYQSASDKSRGLPLNAQYRSIPQKAFLRSSLVLPSPAKMDSQGKYSFDEEGLKAIKSELYKGHGVSLAINVSNDAFIPDHTAVCYDGNNAADHAVVAVGYDDDFPKENFVERDENGNIKRGSLPPQNGALIIKNSWGTVDSEEDGFFYLSYYDHSICSLMSYEFDNHQNVKHTDINYDQYDFMMTEWYANAEYNDETKTANVFEAEENESLFQISYITSLPDTEAVYEIYTDIEDTPSSGRLLEKGENRHTFAGFHKIDLKGEYALREGERYAVVMTMKRAGDDGSVVYTETFPYSTKFSTGLNVTGIVNQGESYLYRNGKWTDMSEMKDSLIEQAYRQLNERLGSKETFTKISLDSKDTFTVDNYPIKAILTPDSH